MGYAWDVSDMHRCVWLVCCEKMAMYYNGNTSVIHVPYIYDIQDLFWKHWGIYTKFAKRASLYGVQAMLNETLLPHRPSRSDVIYVSRGREITAKCLLPSLFEVRVI